jgi:hypothetical protein
MVVVHGHKPTYSVTFFENKGLYSEVVCFQRLIITFARQGFMQKGAGPGISPPPANLSPPPGILGLELGVFLVTIMGPNTA